MRESELENMKDFKILIIDVCYLLDVLLVVNQMCVPILFLRALNILFE